MAKKSTCPPKLRRQRVLYIITKSVWGGAAKYVYDLATRLPKDEFIVLVAAGGQGKFAQEIKEANLPYFEIKNFQKKVGVVKDISAGFEILNLFFKLKPDIIHVNSSKAGGLAGPAIFIYKILYKIQNTKYKIRAIFTAHGWAFAEDRPKWQVFLVKFFSKITALFYNKIICVSGYDREMAIKNKIAPVNKLITIHNEIDVKSINFLPKEQAQKKLLGRTSPLVIGTIAEWTRNKGLFYLLGALRGQSPLLRGLSPEYTFVLIGSGENPDKEKMYDFVKKQNLENVHLIEFIPQAASYLKAFDIFILPSVKEGLPYVILEAMAAELPIIAAKVGGVPEIIDDNINGLLIEPKKPDLIREKIFYLMDNPEKGREMAQKAKIKVEKEFSLEKMLKETKKIYSYA